MSSTSPSVSPEIQSNALEEQIDESVIHVDINEVIEMYKKRIADQEHNNLLADLTLSKYKDKVAKLILDKKVLENQVKVLQEKLKNSVQVTAAAPKPQ